VALKLETLCSLKFFSLLSMHDLSSYVKYVITFGPGSDLAQF
jgi:hypothetical protein